MSKNWSKKEIKLLYNFYLKDNFIIQKELLNQLQSKRSLRAIQQKINNLNLTKESTNLWTEQEINILQEYAHKGSAFLMTKLKNRTKRAITKKAYQQKIHIKRIWKKHITTSDQETISRSEHMRRNVLGINQASKQEKQIIKQIAALDEKVFRAKK